MSTGQCVCRDWCRSDLWGQMIDGRKYPPPNHADGCPAQKREPFTMLEYDGSRVAMEPHEAEQIIADAKESDVNYTTSTVYLTREQFERMDEFTGF